MQLRAPAVAFLASILLGTFASASTPDFSGTWRLNVQRSQYGANPPARRFDKIQQNTAKLTVRWLESYEFYNRDGNETYSLDGKPFIDDSRQYPITSICKWEGGVLTIEARWRDENGDHVQRDRWSLSDGGKVLTIQRRTEGRGSPGEQTLVFEQQ